ncbi:4-oxalocrotonate tautomerase [mine drainage metagenome]|uniref:4-oxalocrotonate tautomerase n=1 Tax=mine drainage metagenome TaxID=410659 RepID=A0A1J5Q6L5_9ZZZZ
MPFTRIAIKEGTPVKKRKDIARNVHQAMVDSIGITEDDFFQLISEYGQEDFFFDRGFLDIDRSDDLVVIQITLRRGRSDAMKRDLYAKIAGNLRDGAGIRPEDIFIYLNENDFSDWSVGSGQMSMAIVQQRGS